MMVTEPSATARAEALTSLREARERTLALVAPLSDADLQKVHSTLMSPLVWDLGHIAMFEDLWISHRLGGRPLLREDLLSVYDAFETPRAARAELPLLRPNKARELLDEVRARTVETLESRSLGDGAIVELVVRHEHQHNETMLQTLELARLADCAPPCAPRDAADASGALTGLEFVEIPAGRCSIGAPAGGFAYDNERPRHSIDLEAFSIGRTPVTNATYRKFVDGGGYGRRGWWSEQGWAWKEAEAISRPGGWTEGLGSEWRLGRLEPLHPDRPVVHVSWFEADAFARAHGLRLPTELEWEKAATWDAASQAGRRYPWGEDPPQPGLHANLDLYDSGPAPVTAFPAGASASGCLGLIGDVWEWTASDFTGYPGFVAHPYSEYSEVFFGGEYKVLRGGSWATRARVATATLRNWDLPSRRQIFSGLRVAEDL